MHAIHPMIKHLGICIIVIFIIALISAATCAATSLHHTKPNNHRLPILWQILPGEDIAETARLIYPKDSASRDNLVRAIIRINPEHFPQGTHRLLTAGTIIQFPDLRTIGTYAKQSSITPSGRKSIKRPVPGPTPKTFEAIPDNHTQLMQLISQLEKSAIDESQILTKLTQHIALLESTLYSFQTLSSPKIEELAADHPTNQTDKPIAQKSLTPSTDPIMQATETAPRNENTAAQHQDSVRQVPESVTSTDTDARQTEHIIFPDTLFASAVLVAVLIVFATLLGYRKAKQRSTRARIDATARNAYETILLKRNDTDSSKAEQSSESRNKTLNDINELIEQNNTEAAIGLLQMQLATNQHDIKGWLQLFELLYKTNNKRDFKKNARRFKRLGDFPDIWKQIQELGHRLEPNEAFYFDEQKRKEKFFPETADTIDMNRY